MNESVRELNKADPLPASETTDTTSIPSTLD